KGSSASTCSSTWESATLPTTRSSKTTGRRGRRTYSGDSENECKVAQVLRRQLERPARRDDVKAPAGRRCDGEDERLRPDPEADLILVDARRRGGDLHDPARIAACERFEAEARVRAQAGPPRPGPPPQGAGGAGGG